MDMEGLYNSMSSAEKTEMHSLCMRWNLEKSIKAALQITLNKEEKDLLDMGKIVPTITAIRKRTGESLLTSKYAADMYRGLM